MSPSAHWRIASRVTAQFRTRASESQRHLPPPTGFVQRLDHSPMTRPAYKTDWHQLNGITHSAASRF